MGQMFEALTEKHIDFVSEQKIYFVGTAASSGSVNVSPKGGDSLRVISPNQIAWLNLTGSGNESAAHTMLDSRMTIMFCAFEGKPLILRAYGQARAIYQTDSDWDEYAALFPKFTGTRQIFLLNIDRVQSSCGMSVPYFDYVEDRELLTDWADKRGKEGIEAYWVKKNQTSIDGFNTDIIERTGVENLTEQ